MAVTSLINRTPDDLKGKRNYVRNVAGSGSPIGDSNLSSTKQFPVGSEYIDLATGNRYVRTSTGWLAMQGSIFSGSGAPAAGFYAAGSQHNYPIGTRYLNTANDRVYTRVAVVNEAADWMYVALT